MGNAINHRTGAENFTVVLHGRSGLNCIFPAVLASIGVHVLDSGSISPVIKVNAKNHPLASLVLK